MYKIVKQWVLGLFLFSFCLSFAGEDSPPKGSHKQKVGLCVMATGAYLSYAEKMIASAREFFCKDLDVTFFVFTDGNMEEAADVVKIHQTRLGWPHDTLKRFHVYLAHKDLFSSMDYVFACDADMLFVSAVGAEVLGDRVGTQHPGFVGKTGTYERKKSSTAYVAKKEGKVYFAGGFYGGTKNEFFTLQGELVKKVDIDLSHDYIAIWHDESHLNRYFVDHPPTVVLSPSYCYPENWSLPYEKKLVALDKPHEVVRKGANL